VAGALRNGAQLAKDWSNEAAVFTDVAPDQLGIERLWETVPGEEDVIVDEPLLVLNNGKVASTLEVVDLIAEHEERRRIAARLLGVQADAPDFRTRLMQAVDNVVAELQAEPAWLQDAPEPSPIVTHDLEAVTVVRNGVQSTLSAAEVRQMVEDASRKAAVWNPEDIGVQYEDDVLWGS
jgi:hypothetical protein